jgi:hypothetical protein
LALGRLTLLVCFARAVLPRPGVGNWGHNNQEPESTSCSSQNQLAPPPSSDLEAPETSQDTTCTMADSNRRPFSIDGHPSASVPHSGAHATAPSTPSLSNDPQFPMAQVPRPAARHTRAQSYTPRRPNRLSLSFPVASASNGSDTRPTPTSSNAPSFPAPAAESVPPSPNDSNSFLVAIAGQERRVLELKEELEKAESELASLKLKWAAHERAKKRAEIRHVQPLQPLQTVTADGAKPNEETDGPSRQSAELDRRKAILSSIAREPRRKVITGGHTRTLSLLSPDRSNYTQPFPPVQESAAEGREAPRNGTLIDTSKGITKIRSRHSYQGGVTDNARQIAVDVKAGLWTFLEDLRQATVGDEAITGKPTRSGQDSPRSGPRRRPSPNSQATGEASQSPQRSKDDLSPRTWDSLTGNNSVLVDAGGTTYYVDESRRKAKSTTPASEADNKPFPPDADELDDSWGNWDSPVPVSPRWSGSTELSGPATPTTANTENRAVQ